MELRRYLISEQQTKDYRLNDITPYFFNYLPKVK